MSTTSQQVGHVSNVTPALPSRLPSIQPSSLPAFHALFLALIALLLTACGAYQFNGTAYPDPGAAPDFELTAADGTPFRLSAQRGQVVLLFFGYTSCPDVCPTTLAEANQLLRGLGDDAGRVTCDYWTASRHR